MHGRNRLGRTLWLAGALAALGSIGLADPSGRTIVTGDDYGRGYAASMGSAVPLTSTSVLMASAGPDDSTWSNDDTVLLITNLDGEPVVTPLLVPNHNAGSGRVTRLSATRAVTTGAGPDGNWYTGDEVLHVLDALGTDNTVTSVTVGILANSNRSSAEFLDIDRVALSSPGPDAEWATDDDLLLLVSGLGGTPVIEPLAAPYIEDAGAARPLGLSPTACLVKSAGMDGDAGSDDDAIHLFTDLGGMNTRTTLSTPGLYFGMPGRPMRIDAARAVMVGLGEDDAYESDDDVLYLLDDLGAANTITPIVIGGLSDYGAAFVAPIDRDTLLTVCWGADDTERTADDELVLVSNLGTTNDLRRIVVGPMEEDVECRPLFIPPSTAAVVTFGTDATMNNADDEVVIVQDLGGADTIVRVPVPGLADGTTSTPTLVGRDCLALVSGGTDNRTNSGLDDVVTIISSASGTPVVQTVALMGDAVGSYAPAQVPVGLGGGLAVLFTGGANGNEGNDDDGLFLIDGLPEGNALDLAKAVLKFKEDKPEKGEKAVAKGKLRFAGIPNFGLNPVTVNVGGATQTLPGSGWKVKKGNWTYTDKTGEHGFVTKFKWKAKTGKFAFKAKGIGTGLETTDPEGVLIVVQSGDAVSGGVLPGTVKKSGILVKPTD